MKNNYRFFCNRDCEYFPCHEMPEHTDFNCLFCYCPLYFLGDKCGGVFEYHSGIKDCTNCHLPHVPEYYDNVVLRLSKAISDGGAGAG